MRTTRLINIQKIMFNAIDMCSCVPIMKHHYEMSLRSDNGVVYALSVLVHYVSHHVSLTASVFSVANIVSKKLLLLKNAPSNYTFSVCMFCRAIWNMASKI